MGHSIDATFIELTQACEELLEENRRLRDEVSQLNQQKTDLTSREMAFSNELENLISRLKLLEQEA